MNKIILNELKDKANDLLGNNSIKKFDVSDFDDPVANQTNWLPLRPKGPRFYPYKLVKVSPTQYRYQFAAWGKILVWVSGILGMLIFFSGIGLLKNRGLESSYGYFLTSFSVLLVPYFLNKSINVYKVFDLSLGCYWKGGKEAKFSGVREKEHRIIYFNKLHALQILSEKSIGRNHSTGEYVYFKYEINFIMKDGSRFNVLYHENKHQVLTDAQLIAQFLGVPVWNFSG